MAKEKDTPKLSYKDIADYILGNQATKDFEAIGPREKFLQKLEDTKRGQEAKPQKKKAAAKEGDAPDLEQPKKKEREEKSPEQAYEAKVHSKSNDIRAKFASHKDDPKFKAYVLELCRDDKLKDILYPGWQKEAGAAPAFPSREEILRQFENKEAHHHYFNTDGARKEAHEQYVRSFLLAKFVDDCIERPDHQQEEDSMAHEMAYKMTIFWRGDLKAVDAYLKSSNYYATNQALHDSLASTAIAADGTQVTLDAWRHLILTTKDAKAVLDNFGNADRIQEKLGKAPANISEIQETAMKLQYARAQEKPEMAVVFRKYKVSEAIFNRCLEIDARKKRKDNLPDVRINGADLDHPGYHLVKLPVDDPRAYILGKITSCCQSIGDHSERCVIDGVTRDNNGFYVLLKGKEGANPLFEDGKINYRDFDIVGQGYAWKTQAGNICFDSWENDGIGVDSKRQASDKVICELLPAYARAVEIMGVDRVSIGCGGKTPQAYKSKGRAESSELMLEGYAYGDASIQAEIGTSSRLLSAREELLPLTQGKSVDQFVSVKSIEAFRNLPGQLIEQLLSNHNYELLTGPLMFPENDANKFYEAIFTHEEKRVALVSDGAILAYKTGAVKASDLINLNFQKILALTSNNATEAYKTGAVKASDLIYLELDKIKALTSGAATRAYQTGAVKASDLKDLRLDQIEALTSHAAIDAYKTEKVKASDLLSDTDKGIHINILQTISQHYCNESVIIPKGIDSNKIKALTSWHALRAYEIKAATVSDLIGLELDKIKALTSLNAILAYETRAVEASDLIGVDLPIIEALTSLNAILAYETRAVEASDLIGVDLPIIEALTSPAATAAYKTRAVEASDLIGVDLRIIEALTSPAAIAAYKTEAVKASEMKGLDLDKIQALTSPAAIAAYKTGRVKVGDLRSDTVKGIHIKILQKIAEHYCQEEIRIPEAIDSNKIQALTSLGAILAYKTRAVKVSDLIGLDLEKIKALTSNDAIRAYQIQAVKASEMKGLGLDKIQALTSGAAVYIYECVGTVKAIHLRDLDLDIIKALTTRGAILAYTTGAVKPRDLKGLGLPKIQALTSSDATEAYKSKVVEPQQVMHLAADKIDEFFKVIRGLQESDKKFNVQQILASPQFSEAKKPLGQKIKDIVSKGHRGVSAAVRVIDKLRPQYLFEDLPGTHNNQDNSENSRRER